MPRRQRYMPFIWSARLLTVRITPTAIINSHRAGEAGRRRPLYAPRTVHHGRQHRLHTDICDYCCEPSSRGQPWTQVGPRAQGAFSIKNIPRPLCVAILRVTYCISAGSQSGRNKVWDTPTRKSRDQEPVTSTQLRSSATPKNESIVSPAAVFPLALASCYIQAGSARHV